MCALLGSARLTLPLCCMQKCTPIAAVMVRVQGPEVCDLVYAATNKQFLRCGEMRLSMLFIQQQLAKVSLHCASMLPKSCTHSTQLCLI